MPLLLPHDFHLFGRVLLAGLLGALLGIECDLNGRPAGLRTNMIIAIGCCLFAILSREGFADAAGQQDPSRIASLVVQGIGFIGAGVLLKQEMKVFGLTTAATIWLVAGIGLAVGAGMLVLAIFITGASLVALTALGPLSAWLDRKGEQRMRRKGKKVITED